MATTFRERLAWLLGLEAKASRTAKLIALQQPVPAGLDAARFRQLCPRRLHAQNAGAYCSVRMIAEAAASVPLLLYEAGHPLAQHPFLSLLVNGQILLECPPRSL